MKALWFLIILTLTACLPPEGSAPVGTRSITTSSGPSFSVEQEFIFQTHQVVGIFTDYNLSPPRTTYYMQGIEDGNVYSMTVTDPDLFKSGDIIAFKRTGVIQDKRAYQSVTPSFETFNDLKDDSKNQ